MSKLVAEYGIDEVLSASEKSLNSYKNGAGKKILGDIVISKIIQEKLEEEVPFVICLIKTNNENIPQFLGYSGSPPKLTVF